MPGSMKRRKNTENRKKIFLLAMFLAGVIMLGIKNPYASEEGETETAEKKTEKEESEEISEPQAANGRVHGRIRTEKAEGEWTAVDGAEVRLEGEGGVFTAVSDEEGIYCIEGAKTGVSYKLVIEKPGFCRIEEEIILDQAEIFCEDTMSLSAEAEISFEKTAFSVGETFTGSLQCDALSDIIEEVQWYVKNDIKENTVEETENGIFRAVRKGAAKICAVACTKYGEIKSKEVQVTIAEADTCTVITAIEPEQGDDVKEIYIKAEVDSEYEKIREGKICFFIERRFSEGADWISVAQRETEYDIGETGFCCVYLPERGSINGMYRIRAEYQGVSEKYKKSCGQADTKGGYFNTPPIEVLWGGGLEKKQGQMILETEYTTKEDREQQEKNPFLAVDTENIKEYMEEGEVPSEQQLVFIFSADPGQIRFYRETGEEAGDGGEAEVRGGEKIFLYFVRACKEGETFAVTVSSQDFQFHRGAEMNFQIRVNPKQVTLSTGQQTIVTYTKIYDKEKVFSSYETEMDSYQGDVWSGIDTILISGAGSGEDVQVKEIKGVQEIVSVKLDNNKNPTGQKSDLTITGAVLTGEQADNYFIDLEKSEKIKAEVTVLPRKIYLQISEGEREYGHRREDDPESICYPEKNPVREWKERPGAQPQTEGIVDMEDEAEIRFPIPTEKKYDTAEYPDYPEGRYENAITVLRELKGMKNGEAGTDYQFVFEEGKIAEGALLIKREDVAAHGYRNYVNYEKDLQSVYISRESMETGEFGKVWAGRKNKNFHVFLSDRAAEFYDQIYLQSEGEEEDVKISGDGPGINLSKAAGEIPDGKIYTAAVYLKHSGSGQKSETFEIRLCIDSEKPFVSKSSITKKTSALDHFLDRITFGKFYRKSSRQEEIIQVSDGEGSGIREWSYHIMSGEKDSDFTKESIQAYISPENGNCIWQDVYRKEENRDSATGQRKIYLPKKEGSYVVLIHVKDNVGQEQVITSNGFILDYKSPVIAVSLAEGQFESSTGIYREDVRLNIYAEDIKGDAASPRSGIKRVEVQVEAEGRVTQQDILLDMEKETGKTEWTLQEIDQEGRRGVNLSYTVKSLENNSNDVKVTATVTDQAGNESSAEYSMKIDVTDPKLDITYFCRTAPENQIYYRQPVQAEIIYTERNFADDKEHLWFYVETEKSGTGCYSIQEMEEKLGISAEWKKLGAQTQQDTKESECRTDDRKHILVLTFEKDEHYRVTPYVRDMAETEDKTDRREINGEPRNFVIDRTPPRIQVSYWTEDAQSFIVSKKKEGEIYKNRPVNAEVRILEHNFSEEDKQININLKVKAENLEQGKKIPDYGTRAKKNSEDVWRRKEDMNMSSYYFQADAGYSMEIVYTDLAGNTAVYTPAYFTVDKTCPTGSIRAQKLGFWTKFLETITFGLFSQTEVKVEIRGNDHTSPIYPVEYACFHSRPTREELEEYQDWRKAEDNMPGYAEYFADPDTQFVICSRVTDYAGNCEYFSSDGIIADSTSPGPKIAVTALNRPQNGIFKEDVVLQIQAEDPKVGDTYSGLECVWYTVTAEGNVTAEQSTELFRHTGERIQGNKSYKQTVTVPAEVYNSSRVKVQAFARDFAGNTGKSEITELKIDVTDPLITVSWDDQKGVNGTYYKEIRTAMVTITERSFDPAQVVFEISGTDGAEAELGQWTISPDKGISDQAAHTCTVVFSEDGDYTFGVKCTDLAGNSSSYKSEEKFTIDRTAPVVTVSYDKEQNFVGGYCREPVTAVITIDEHNFQEKDVKTAVTAKLQGEDVTSPFISRFEDRGDIHTAEVKYMTDGDYTFDIQYTDLAGNPASVYKRDRFTVDLTPPSVEIFDIIDQSANCDTVAPEIRVSDRNYDSAKLEITITGERNGTVKMEKTRISFENGEQIKFHDFVRKEEIDDLYCLRVRAEDRAGNKTEKTVRFSVNRYGSVYMLDEDTKQWLSTSDSERIYLKEEKDVGIVEYNLDTSKSARILINHNGDLKKLREGTDYTVEEPENERFWKKRYYRICRENFTEEGIYTVILNTEDRAGNIMTNTSMKKEGRNLPIVFAIDKTGPSVVLSGAEDKGQYRESQRRIKIDAKDNLYLKKVFISVDGETRVYEEKELRETEGVISISVAGANHWQKIEIRAEDAAGNCLGENEENKKAENLQIEILVTPDILVQYYMNKPLFFASLLGGAAGMSVFFYFMSRRKQHTQQ